MMVLIKLDIHWIFFLQWINVPKESTEFKITADLDVNTFKSTETP